MELNNLEIRILKALEEHQGKENAIGRFHLLDLINLECPLFPVHERKMRETIKHLVTQHGVAIGSNSRGYYLAITPQEIDEICEYYDSYVHNMAFVSSRLKKIGIREYYGQLSMKFGGAT